MKKIPIYLLLLLCTSVSRAQLPGYLPLDGLVAWFPFTGNFVDSTGNGHDGTPHGPTAGKGRYGVPNTAYWFNGTSDYVYIPAGTLVREQSVNITASLTISAWVKSYNYFFSSQMQIYWRGDATPAYDPHMLYLNGGQVRLRRDVDPGATVNEVGSSLTGLDTSYHLFTGTYDSATSIMRIYVDGILKNQAYLPGTQTYPTSTMYNYIGAVDGGTWQFFYGYIDELAIWNRALTPCEVAALYYSSPGVVTGQPANDTVVGGGAASFTVSAAAPAPAYQWQVNTGSGFTNLSATAPYSGVHTATLTISPVTLAMSGNLYRCIISSDSCLNVNSISAKLVVDTPTAATSLETPLQQISVTPNPNTGVFILQGSSNDKVIAIEIIDMIGRIVHSEEIVPSRRQVNSRVTLNSTLANGTYFLKIRSRESNQVIRITLER